MKNESQGMISLRHTNKRVLAQQCLLAGLYSEGGMMSYFYRHLQRVQISAHQLMVAFQDHQPVGALLRIQSGSVMVFVLPAYRRKGIGSLLVNMARQVFVFDPQAMKVDLSTEQAKRFYKETGFDTTSHGQVSWNRSGPCCAFKAAVSWSLCCQLTAARALAVCSSTWRVRSLSSIPKR